MAKATGTVVIALAGGSFDSADYPRFVLGDGTNSLTFVIDNDARGLKDQDGNDAKSGDYTGGDATSPLEDSQKGRLVVPTLDEADGATKALLSFEMTDQSNFQAAAINSSLNSSGGALEAITGIPHFIFRDADGNSVTVGIGAANGSNISSDGTYTLIAKYGSSSSRYWLYRKNSTSSYFIRCIDSSGNDWRFHTALMQAINHANANSLINIEAFGSITNGTLAQPSSIANDTYTSSETNMVVFKYTSTGFKGNACSMKFVDGTISSGFTTTARKKSIRYGYDEFLASDQNILYVTHHTLSPTDDQFLGLNYGTEIFFRQGTIGGSGSDAALSTANIAEAIKEMVNGSRLGITATRSDSTVSLENDVDGDSGNVTITTTNEGSLFSVTGMSNAGGGGGGGGGGGTSIMARTRIGSKLIAVGGITKDNISSGSVNIGHLNFSEANAHSGSMNGQDRLVIQALGGSTRAVTLDHLEAYLSASVLTDLTASGDVILGDATSDDIKVVGRLITGLVPKTDNVNDLGGASNQWKDLYVNGIGYIDQIGTDADPVAGYFNAGEIDGVVIGGESAAAGTFTTASGSTGQFHDLAVDDLAAGGISASSITASNGVILGSSNADDLVFLGGQVSDLIPQNDNKVALGSAAKRYSLISAMSASIAGAVGIVGTATVGALTSAGTVSGSAATFHDLSADDAALGGVTVDSLTASNGVILGSSNADDLSFLGGQITDLVPQNDNKVALGSAAKRYSLISAMSASIAGAVGVVGTITAGGLSSDGTISGSTGQFRSLSADFLDVRQIQTTVRTDNTLEIADKTITAAVSASSAETHGGGLKIGGERSSGAADSLAALLWDHGNSALDFNISGTTQIRLQDGVLRPETDNDVDLGASGAEFKDLYLDGTANIDMLKLPDVTSGKFLVADGTSYEEVAMSGDATLASNGALTIGTGKVSRDNLATGSVGHEQLAVGAVTVDNLATGSVQHAQLGVGAVTVDNLATGSVQHAQLGVGAVTVDNLATGSVQKAALHEGIVKNNSDAHGGINFSSGLMSVGFRKVIFVRSDGSNISGSVPTKGMFANKAVPTPYTTASLGAQPQSGSLMVYLNGILLHGEHHEGAGSAYGGSPHDPNADYRITTASNAHTVLLNSDLALDSDDVLTVTYLSGAHV